MRDLKNPYWIWLKGLLFLAVGMAALVLVLIERPSWKVAALLAVSVWGFCRFYFFTFYVIEHYVDDRYRFSGIGSFVRYLVAHGRRERKGE